jgi:hypothetical protein
MHPCRHARVGLIDHDRGQRTRSGRTRRVPSIPQHRRHQAAASPPTEQAETQREPEETSQSWRSADPGGAAAPAQNLGQRELNLLSQPRRHAKI